MLSVVVPTLNEESYLPRLLKDLQKQTYENFETIVADSESDDRTKEIAKDYECELVSCEGRRGPGHGRNKGASTAKGKYFLFLDADVRIPDEKFLEKLMKKVERKNIDLATFNFLPEKGDKLDNLIAKVTVQGVKIFGTLEPFSPGFCTFVSREIHEKIGGYDEDLFMAEDWEYVKHASKIAKFFVIDQTVFFSPRRIEDEGKFTIYRKNLFVNFYRLLNGEIKGKLFDYEFGKFNLIGEKSLSSIFDLG